MTTHSPRRDEATRRAHLARDIVLVLVSAALAAAIVWLIAQSVALSAATALVLLALGALWLWRTRRAGVPDSGTESIDDARRTPGEMGPYWQPGTSGFGTPGLGG